MAAVYRLNTLNRNVLIMTDEVIRHAPTKHTLDPRMLENSIIIAEERFIVPALGYDYYQALIAEKNKAVTDVNKAALETAVGTTLEVGQIVNAAEFLSEDNKAIWNYILWKFLAECILIIAYPEGFIQFTSSGVVHENPIAGPMGGTGVSTPDLRSMKWAMDKKMQDRIDPLHEAMHLWLCKQKTADKTKYALYTKHCDCNADGVPYKRKTDVILGLYDDCDDDDDRRRRRNRWNRDNDWDW